jgi:hypothetical protein
MTVLKIDDALRIPGLERLPDLPHVDSHTRDRLAIGFNTIV